MCALAVEGVEVVTFSLMARAKLVFNCLGTSASLKTFTMAVASAALKPLHCMTTFSMSP